jgi:hypothetical protein
LPRTSLPLQGAALPDALPGTGWSDHWSFWQAGYQAMMVTDTAPWRYPLVPHRRRHPGQAPFGRMTRFSMKNSIIRSWLMAVCPRSGPDLHLEALARLLERLDELHHVGRVDVVVRRPVIQHQPAP